MKKLNYAPIVLIMMLVILLPLTSCAQTRLLTEFPSGQGVEKVFINKNMMNLGSGLMNHSLGSYQNNLKSMDGVEIYSCENSSLFPEVKEKLDNLINDYHGELMIESEEENETSLIYTLYNGKDRKNSIGIAIITEQKNEINIIIIQGQVSFGTAESE